MTTKTTPSKCLAPDLDAYQSAPKKNEVPWERGCIRINDREMHQLLNWMATLPTPERVVYNRFQFVLISFGVGENIKVTDQYSGQTIKLSDVDSW